MFENTSRHSNLLRLFEFIWDIFMSGKQQSEILLQFVWGLAIIWNTMIIIVCPGNTEMV